MISQLYREHSLTFLDHSHSTTLPHGYRAHLTQNTLLNTTILLKINLGPARSNTLDTTLNILQQSGALDPGPVPERESCTLLDRIRALQTLLLPFDVLDTSTQGVRYVSRPNLLLVLRATAAVGGLILRLGTAPAEI